MDATTYLMPFGRYSGKPIEQCPSKYLEWVVKKVTAKSREKAQMVSAADIELHRRGYYGQVAQP